MGFHCDVAGKGEKMTVEDVRGVLISRGMVEEGGVRCGKRSWWGWC